MASCLGPKFDTSVVEILVAVLLPLCILPQILKIWSTRSTAGISPWYILLLSLASSTQLASRLENEFSQVSFECVRDGRLRGWKALLALVVYITVELQFLCTLVLLAVYVHYRDQSPDSTTRRALDTESVSQDQEVCNSGDHDDPSSPLLAAFPNSAIQKVSFMRNMQPSASSDPSVKTLPTTKLLTIFYVHGLLVIPLGFAIHYLGPPDREQDFNKALWYMIVQRTLHGILAVSGVLFALGSAIPQIKLMLARLHRGEGLGSLSEPGLWLQVNVLFYLGASQAMRLGWPRFGDESQAELTSWEWFVLVNGCAVGFVGMSVAQVAVLGMAKWVERRLETRSGA